MRDRPDDHTHRRVAEQKIGRALKPSEVVDHADENKSNNSPSNLSAVDRGVHTAHHNRLRATPLSKLRRSLRMVDEGRKLY